MRIPSPIDEIYWFVEKESLRMSAYFRLQSGCQALRSSLGMLSGPFDLPFFSYHTEGIPSSLKELQLLS